MCERKDYNRQEVVEAFLKICDTLAYERKLLLQDIERSKVGSFESAVALKDKDRVVHIERLLLSNKDMLKRFFDSSSSSNSYIREFMQKSIPLHKLVNNPDFLEVVESYNSLSVLKTDIDKLKKYSL